MAYQLHHGDCVDVLATLPAESVDAVVTSPPYAMQRASTYGGVPEAEYPDWTVAWMREMRRVLKPDGSVIINIRPHIRNGQISDYTLRMRLALREAGWRECEELIWHKPNGVPIGSVARPRRSWESLHWFAKHGKPFCAPRAAGSAPIGEMRAAHTTASRLGWNVGQGAPLNAQPQVARVADVFRLGTGSKVGVDHPAPFPWQLAEWCGKLICPTGGTILDPFMGSASTGVAALRNGWDFVGIDSAEEYVDMSRRRLDAEAERIAGETGLLDMEVAA